MNIKEFEDNVRNGLAPVSSTDQLSAKIDHQLWATKRKRTVRRRFGYSFAATAAATVGMIVIPTVMAQAHLRRLAGALDNVSSVILTTESVSADGTRKQIAESAYLDGKWRLKSPGSDVSYFSNGNRYRLDRASGHFIAESGLDGPFGHNSDHLSMSDVLGDIKRWRPQTHLTFDSVELGAKSVTRATIEVDGENSREILYADKSTDLPIKLVTQAKRIGNWATLEEANFDYETKQRPEDFVPDLKTYPPIAKRDWDAANVAKMTKDNLGTIKTSHGELIIRSMDVAKDGTVFVTCQAGERVPNWNRGYPIAIEDNLRTQYALAEIESRVDKEFIEHSKDGKLELCVFIPTEPLPIWKPRTITINAMMVNQNQLQRKEIAYWGGRHTNYCLSKRWYYDRDHPATPVKVMSRAFDAPTVDRDPSYTQFLNPWMFEAGDRFDREKAQARADYYRDVENPPAEIRWLNRTIELTHETGSINIPQARLDEIREIKPH